MQSLDAVEAFKQVGNLYGHLLLTRRQQSGCLAHSLLYSSLQLSVLVNIAVTTGNDFQHGVALQGPGGVQGPCQVFSSSHLLMGYALCAAHTCQTMLVDVSRRVCALPTDHTIT